MTAGTPVPNIVEDPALAPIVEPYLLVLFSVPFHVDAAGRRWIDGLWAKDLLEHTRYIKHLTVASRVVNTPVPANAVAMDQVPALQTVRWVELPESPSLLKGLMSLPRTCRLLWKEVGRAHIVHSSVAAWPVPEAWLLVPMLWLRRRILYINVESAFWRLVPGQRVAWHRRARSYAFETLNRLCVESSDISTFTHEGYRRSLLKRGLHRGHVVEASWIDQGKLLTGNELSSAVARRREDGRRLRLVFAGRITRDKGILLLIEAAGLCLQAGIELELDIFGEGPLMAECVECAQQHDAAGLRIRFRASLPYDHRFFEALRQYDVLVVPSITDEQPRVVFDAYSQGLPVIASRTEGLLQCVEDGVTGLMFDSGDVQALHAQLARVAANPSTLSDMAGACLARARRLTHQNMHRTRWRLLIDAFPALTGPNGRPAAGVSDPAYCNARPL